MDAVEYRMIKLEELSRELFRSFQRRQVVNLFGGGKRADG